MSLFKAPKSSELWNYIWQEITVRGWLHTVRLVWSKLAFLILRDGDWLMQIVIEKLDMIERLRNMQSGTVISATGKVSPVPKWKFSHEIQNADIEILQAVEFIASIDISKDEVMADFDTIHDNKAIYLRHPKQVKIFKLAHQIEKTVRDFFENNKFVQINTPKFLGFPTEGWAEVFELNYFDRKAWLAQSPQFYKQMMCASFERVYEIGKAYRAEKSHTSRHTTEIQMIDCEMSFLDSFQDVLDMADDLMHYLIDNLRANNEKTLSDFGLEKPRLSDKIPNITMPEVHEIVFQRTGKDYRAELDLVPEEEVVICEYALEKYWSEAVFVSGFPRSDAKFYHKQDVQNPAFADRADLLFRWLEMATVTRREVNYHKLVEQIESKWYDPANPGLKAYLDAFKYGMPEQWGFGMGLSRLVYKLLNLQNIKEAELFPRDCVRLTP